MGNTCVFLSGGHTENRDTGDFFSAIGSHEGS